MSNLKTLSKVVELATRRRDDALAALGQAQRELQAAQDQMHQLRRQVEIIDHLPDRAAGRHLKQHGVRLARLVRQVIGKHGIQLESDAHQLILACPISAVSPDNAFRHPAHEQGRLP